LWIENIWFEIRKISFKSSIYIKDIKSVKILLLAYCVSVYQYLYNEESTFTSNIVTKANNKFYFKNICSLEMSLEERFDRWFLLTYLTTMTSSERKKKVLPGNTRCCRTCAHSSWRDPKTSMSVVHSPWPWILL